MITLNSLSKIYRTDEIETVALENVNLTVERGEFSLFNFQLILVLISTHIAYYYLITQLQSAQHFYIFKIRIT